MSWKCEVKTGEGSRWDGNSLRFGTEEEAALYARDLYSRWTLVTKWQAIPSSDAVTHRWAHGKAERIEQ